MQQFASLHEARAQKTWLTIGAFDGIHLGHQKILNDLTAGAHSQNAPAVVLTFSPHPAEVLRGPRSGFYISDPDEKATLIEHAGVDILITHPFHQTTANTPASDFVSFIKRQLDFQHLFVGPDFALGHNREGDVSFLQKMGAQMDFEVHVMQPVELDGDVVSSSRIRALLAEGDVSAAARLLGRQYSLFGEVVPGAKRGRGLGIPTANLRISEKRALPANGIYVTRATLGNKRWGSVSNVGFRPTFEDNLPSPVVEALLLDYQGPQFYGQTLHLDFIVRLRPEEKFPTVDEMMVQIHKDIEAARSVLLERTSI